MYRTWHSLVFGEEIFQENPDKRKQNGTSRFTAHICDLAFKPRRESQSHSESYESQESSYDCSIPTFAQPRTRKSRERSEAAGQLSVASFNWISTWNKSFDRLLPCDIHARVTSAS